VQYAVNDAIVSSHDQRMTFFLLIPAYAKTIDASPVSAAFRREIIHV
jgi:hypothetical protein